MIFLNACIFFLGIGAIAKLIVGQEDGPLLAIGALLAIVVRVFLWLVDRRLRGRLERDGRKPKRGT